LEEGDVEGGCCDVLLRRIIVRGRLEGTKERKKEKA
jgi:hypothetical protein